MPPQQGRRRRSAERGGRRSDLAVAPNENDVEQHEQHEARLQPAGRRDCSDNRRHRQARRGDQRHTGGLSGDRLGREPREQVERRHEQGGQPRTRPAAGDSRQRSEERGRDRRKSGQEGRAAARLRERDTDRQRGCRNRDADQTGGREPPRSRRDQYEESLQADECQVGW